VLKKIFGPKREEVTGGWRKLHDEKFQKFYSPSNIVSWIKLEKRKRQVAGH
jgi:hypothetical protein